MNAAFFTGNRKRLAEKVQGGLVVLTAYGELQRGNDTAHPFEQEANFWYLTGINHPDWRVVIDGTSGESWLIAPDIAATHELFDGSLSAQEATAISGISQILSTDDGDALLRRLSKKHSVAYSVDHPQYASHFGFHLNPVISQHMRKLERTFSSVRDCSKELAKLRAIKQPEELAALKKATKLTVEAFAKLHENLNSYRYEYEVEAYFSQYFRHRGARQAYDPIVAGGGNACTLHYNRNQAKLKARRLLLIDIGARVDGYPADVTRTYAIGEPTKRHKEIHGELQHAHQEIIEMLEPGLPVQEYMQKVDARMKQALMQLKLLKNLDDDATYRQYFPHAISHGLGIDVHDSLGAPRVFEAGMVLTVEPGVYIPAEGIGIRLEDDIVITEKGNQNLTGSLSTGL